jgi:hypothetical protein
MAKGLELLRDNRSPTSVRLVSKAILAHPKTSAKAFLSAIILLFFGFYWLHPFGQRYQGKRVSDWVTYYAKTKIPVSEEVVLAFGTNAIPDLVKECNAGTRLRENTHFSRRLFEFLFERLLIIRREGIAHEWAAILYLDDPSVLPAILATNRRELINVVIVHCPIEELNAFRSQSTNLILKMDVESMLKWRDWSGLVKLWPRSVREIVKRKQDEAKQLNTK